MEQFQWYANLVDIGPATDTEYLIPVNSLPNDNILLSIVFYQIRANDKMARFPGHLSDGAIDRELISGSAKDGLQFDPDSWVQLLNLK